MIGSFFGCGTSRRDSSASGGSAGKAAGSDTGANSSGGSMGVAGEAPDGRAGTSPAEPMGGADQGAGGSTGGTSSAGEPGSAGSASGAAGAQASSGPECESDDQCAVFNDCCECDVGAASEEHPQCEKLCIQSACDARGITAQPRCRSKRCVFDLSCDHSQVTCKSAKPECPAGQIPSVTASCWGPCIDVSQCSDVTDCSACPADTVCVANSDSPGSFVQCVEVAASCAEAHTCDCTDACPFSCSATSDGVSCFCLAC
ncbi:MAG TPA: hypothetical protein VEX18_02060 [Polyangiaceae bacterium]|nr:hypothetical protein [Polyangiaceae bacterium]